MEKTEIHTQDPLNAYFTIPSGHCIQLYISASRAARPKKLNVIPVPKYLNMASQRNCNQCFVITKHNRQQTSSYTVYYWFVICLRKIVKQAVCVSSIGRISSNLWWKVISPITQYSKRSFYLIIMLIYILVHFTVYKSTCTRAYLNWKRGMLVYVQGIFFAISRTESNNGDWGKLYVSNRKASKSYRPCYNNEEELAHV